MLARGPWFGAPCNVPRLTENPRPNPANRLVIDSEACDVERAAAVPKNALLEIRLPVLALRAEHAPSITLAARNVPVHVPLARQIPARTLVTPPTVRVPVFAQ